MDTSPNNPLDRIGDICTQMLIGYEVFAKKYGIGGNELAIFYTLWTDGGCTQKHIADKCQIAKQTISTLCKKYEADGIIRSAVNHSDKREKVLVLTEKGKAFARPVIETLLDRENKTIDEFGIGRMGVLLDEFEKLQTMLSRNLE